MDFDQLNIFLEVARHSSFSRAAQKCFRTQPAISSSIKSLEDELGVKLFDRSGGRVSLTAPGKAFLNFAEELLDTKRRAMNAVVEMDRVPKGEIIVGANEGTCLHVLPEVFAHFKKQYPDVNVSVARSERTKIIEQVLENIVDFGIVSAPVEDPRLKVVTIHRDELVLITPPKHPLNRTNIAATLEEIAAYPLLLPKVGRTRDAIESAFDQQSLKTNISMELESSEVLKRFVAADVGIGFIARSNVNGDVKAKTLAAIPLDGVAIRRDLALIYRKDKALSRAAQAFIAIAVKIKAPGAAAAHNGQ
ncbi:MAG TPA: LysR family transcriptional regulator [Terriglobales bacterium]|nr:LysR family transcriptional regulator [Terriglobales bacterium]